jgi:hypothetical protein
MIALYVDDIPAACNYAAWHALYKAHLGAGFKIKDMGDLSQLLGMDITRNRSARNISLGQSKYLLDILTKYGKTDSRPSSLPMDPGFLSDLAQMTSPPLTGVAKDVYPSLMGSLQYAAACKRPDVTTALSILGSDQASSTEAHLQAVKKVLRYMHGIIDMRLTLGGHGPQSPTCTLCRRRLGKRQHHPQVTFGLSLYPRMRAHQLQVKTTYLCGPIHL